MTEFLMATLNVPYDTALWLSGYLTGCLAAFVINVVWGMFD